MFGILSWKVIYEFGDCPLIIICQSSFYSVGRAAAEASWSGGCYPEWIWDEYCHSPCRPTQHEGKPHFTIVYMGYSMCPLSPQLHLQYILECPVAVMPAYDLLGYVERYSWSWWGDQWAAGYSYLTLPKTPSVHRIQTFSATQRFVLCFCFPFFFFSSGG